ncbi:MAG: phosphotransferase, partial [Proteobacteria bacterium]|nr:phosphotransferase [Pseudomonadota bacterium]
MHLEIAQSTPTAASVGRLVQAHYGLGEVVESEFLRRSFNQVYRLRLADGSNVVARLSAQRPRGAPNVQFEAQVLSHLAAQGSRVSRCLRTVNGGAAVRVALPEGECALMVFEFLEGEFTGESTEDIRAFAGGLAALHAAGESYRGAGSAYELDLDYLLVSPLDKLLGAPTMTDELRPQFEDLGRRLHERIQSLGDLSRVLCHGDAHGMNNFVVPSAQGGREAVFFDFDEAGPGFLAYELAVYPWVLWPRSPEDAPGEKVLRRWRDFIGAYREARPVPDADLQAIAPFMAVRQFWLLGEYA